MRTETLSEIVARRYLRASVREVQSATSAASQHRAEFLALLEEPVPLPDPNPVGRLSYGAPATALGRFADDGGDSRFGGFGGGAATQTFRSPFGWERPAWPPSGDDWSREGDDWSRAAAAPHPRGRGEAWRGSSDEAEGHGRPRAATEERGSSPPAESLEQRRQERRERIRRERDEAEADRKSVV